MGTNGNNGDTPTFGAIAKIPGKPADGMGVEGRGQASNKAGGSLAPQNLNTSNWQSSLWNYTEQLEALPLHMKSAQTLGAESGWVHELFRNFILLCAVYCQIAEEKQSHAIFKASDSWGISPEPQKSSQNFLDPPKKLVVCIGE